MVDDSSFPMDGWLSGASNSYGTDELFRGTPRTLVRIFPHAAEAQARATYEFLIHAGVKSAALDLIDHVDGSSHYYVWAERDEMMRLMPDVVPVGKFGER